MTNTVAAAIIVNSTLLASVRYESDAACLHLEFRDGTLYCYFGASIEIYEDLLAAPSKGRYFNCRIRGSFQYALLRPSA